jgi:hypothetical protein
MMNTDPPPQQFGIQNKDYKLLIVQKNGQFTTFFLYSIVRFSKRKF